MTQGMPAALHAEHVLGSAVFVHCQMVSQPVPTEIAAIVKPTLVFRSRQFAHACEALGRFRPLRSLPCPLFARRGPVGEVQWMLSSPSSCCCWCCSSIMFGSPAVVRTNKDGDGFRGATKEMLSPPCGPRLSRHPGICTYCQSCGASVEVALVAESYAQPGQCEGVNVSLNFPAF